MEQGFQYKITVFTPTYNRAYILHTLYESLVRQSFRNFEWLIIDDGSTDETETLISGWVNDNKLPIRYYKQPNGGKHRAINWALDLAEGELFFTVDSDDYLTDDALEKVAKWEAELPKDGIFCGIAGNDGFANGETPNHLFEEDFFEGTMLDRYKEANGERAYVFYTDVHRKYKYPVFEGEKFMTEAVVWNRMARDGYKMRFYNDIIWIYEYKEDGLTKAGNSLFVNNPHGYVLWLKEKMDFEKAGAIQKWKFYYTMYAELSPHYDKDKIAEYLQTKKANIHLCQAVYKLKH